MSEFGPWGGPGLNDRAVLDALNLAVIVTDPGGQIQMWNAAAEVLYGWRERDVLGMSVLDVLGSADDIAADRDAMSQLAAGSTMTGDRTVMSRGGQPVRVATFTRPVLDEAGEVVMIVGASQDVADVRLAEQRTRDLTEHFRLALQAGGLGTWRWDMATGATTWDERLEALFGLPPGGFDGTFDTYVSLLHPDDRDDVLNHVMLAVNSRSTYRVEHRVVWPDGSVHWLAGAGGVTVDDRGNVTGTVGCSVDITARVEQQLEREAVAALAVQAADRERLSRERLEFLSAVNDALNVSSSVREIMVNVANAAVPRLGDWCSIHVLPASGLIPDVEIAHVDPEMVAYARELQQRFPYDPSAPTGVPQVIRTGETQFFPDITDEVIAELDATDEQRAVIAKLALRSAIAVPLIKRDRVVGAMQFVMSSSSRRYTEDDVALAVAVASRVASSLENRRLNEEHRLIAQTLQRSLLPESLPDIPGVELAVRYWPAGEATEVGGDFYDVFALDGEQQWAVVIGDVCGTGPQAAALVGLARHSIRDSAWHADTPIDVLNSLNRAMRRSDGRSYLTAVYATLDTTGEHIELTVTCGGHPLPVLASAGDVSTIGTPGTLLGILDSVSLHPQTTLLEPGDVVVFYTDGATDVRPPHTLTATQFNELVGHVVAAGGTAEVIADGIRDALERIVPIDRRNDDIAVLVVRVNHTTVPSGPGRAS